MLPTLRFLVQCAMLGASGVFLTGCATPSPVGTSGSSAGTSGAALPGTPNGSPVLRAQTQRELQSRGWQFVGTVGPATDPNLVFLKPNTYQKINELSKITTLDVFSAESIKKFNSNRSASFEWEVNCGAKTTRIASFQLYKDGLGTVQAAGRSNVDTKPAAIAPASMQAAVYSKVCESGPSSGTGVVVSQSRVLTASHVINKCTAVEAVFNGKRYPAQVLAQDQKNDLGLVSVEGLAVSRGLAIRRNALNGESVMAAGYPLSGLLSADLTVTTGIVNSLAGLANDPSQLQISAQVSPGNSGGGLLDKSGNLLGIVVSKLDVLRVAAVTGDMAQNVNFAVKPEVIKLFLDANGVRINSADSSTRLEGEDLAARAKEVTVKMECKSRPPVVLSGLNGQS